MKKNLFNGLLLLAVVSAGAGTFSSCTDDNGDELSIVESKIDQLAESQVTELNKCKKECQDAREELEKKLIDLTDKHKKDLEELIEAQTQKDNAQDSQIKGLEQKIKELEERIQVLETAIIEINKSIASINVYIADFESRIAELEAFKEKYSVLDPDAVNTFMQEHNLATNITIQNILNDIQILKNTVQNIENNYVNKNDFDAHKLDFETLKSTVNNLSGDLGNLNTTVQKIQADLDAKYGELNKKVQDGIEAWKWINDNEYRLKELEDADTELKKLIDKNTADILKNASDISQNAGDISQNANDISKNAADILANKSDILTNKEAINDLKNKLSDLESKLNSKITDVESTVTNHTSLISALQGDVATINANIAKLGTDFAALQDRVAANEASIKAIQQDLDKLFGLSVRLNKLVTGIINQATCNPVFGSFNFPFNVRSNMLITYFGSSEKDNVFPSYSSAAEYNGDLVFTEKDIEMLNASGNFKQFAYAQGDVLMNTEDGNAGMVFLTINPNNVDFTGVNLSMVNSQDVESGMKLKNLKRSDKEISFGISRAANNGFYEAQATVDPSHVNEIAVKIEPGLKSAFKDALQNRGKKDFAQLAKVLYAQVTDILPANGLKAAWTAPDGQGNMKEYATYSNYDIAATAVAPLSFKFMEGQTIDKRLPIITPLDEFEFDKSKFTFDIDVPPFHINDVELSFTLDHVNITDAGDILVTIEVPTEVDPMTGKVTKTKDVVVNLSDDINDVLDQVEADVNGTIDNWNESIRNDFKEALQKLTDDIEKQVDDMMDDVMGQIDSNLDKLIDEINKEVHDALGGYFDKANKVINKYNKLADKINARLENPNFYLQSMACYQGTDGDFHQLSNAINMPSPFKLAGGNAITIYLTSYNAEIVVPSFMKFIAVTNVWNEATGMSAQDGDAEAKQLLIEANGQEYMNQPITGKQQRVAFSASKAGFKYEIVYSALDYRGWTSSRKYYVSVK